MPFVNIFPSKFPYIKKLRKDEDIQERITRTKELYVKTALKLNKFKNFTWHQQAFDSMLRRRVLEAVQKRVIKSDEHFVEVIEREGKKLHEYLKGEACGIKDPR